MRVRGAVLAGGLVLAASVAAGIAAAQIVPWHSIFPQPRPAHIGPSASGATSGAAPSVAPAPRTDDAVVQALADPPRAGDASPLAVARSLVPRPRPPAAAARYLASGTRAPNPVRAAVAAGGAVSRSGGLCGNPAIEGRTLSRIPGRLAGCGVESPVSVSAVHGIPLSQDSTFDCETALAVARYVDEVMVPVVGRRGGGIDRVNVAAHYSCRTRNNRAGAPISEHGRGRAIDISGYRLRDGTTVTVLEDWRRRPHRSDLREMYQRACGIFTTTLGPDSDRYHQDHFHFDRARHRNGGSYCP